MNNFVFMEKILPKTYLILANHREKTSFNKNYVDLGSKKVLYDTIFGNHREKTSWDENYVDLGSKKVLYDVSKACNNF